MLGSIVFVHGTGVRLEGYAATLASVKAQVAVANIAVPVVACAWGEPLGITYGGRSLPDGPSEAQLSVEASELARWTWLLDDPLAEMDRLAIRDTRATEGALPPPGIKPEWQKRLEAIKAYTLSQSAEELLTRVGVTDLWPGAAATVVKSAIVREALERSAEAGELPDAIAALARAVVAELHRRATEAMRPAPSAALRGRLCRILVVDWGGAVAGLSTFLTRMFERAGTSIARRNRATLNALAAAPIGDVLLYQSRGHKIRDFIRKTIEAAPGPALVVAHSLGGIACVDLLASDNPPAVEGLVTIGSQSPLFHEFGALAALKEGQDLPYAFPPWLNVFDRNDFLSFVGERIFGGRIKDFEVYSGQPFPDSHSAYFANPEVWTEIARFFS
ncbi:hypothetical protein ACU8NU_26215 (plasmid) [Rhizobium leguminosarum]